MTGIELIAAERKRQMEVEGWTPAHDDEHNKGELIAAAVGYAQYVLYQFVKGEPPEDPPCDWPFEDSWWKPSPDHIRNLQKAGALIAAEIDRLQREALEGR